MTGIVLGAIIGILVTWSAAAGWTRLTRTGSDKRDAEAKVRHFRRLWWTQLGQLLRPLGWLIAAVLIVAALAIYAGGRQ